STSAGVPIKLYSASSSAPFEIIANVAFSIAVSSNIGSADTVPSLLTVSISPKSFATSGPYLYGSEHKNVNTAWYILCSSVRLLTESNRPKSVMSVSSSNTIGTSSLVLSMSFSSSILRLKSLNDGLFTVIVTSKYRGGFLPPSTYAPSLLLTVINSISL